MTDRVEYWLELAEYDIDTALVMLDGGRYLYVVFMCHQVIEKMLKAYYVKIRAEMPPYTHNLELLTNKSGLNRLLDQNQIDFLRRMESMNVESRYPADRELLSKALTPDKCRSMLQSTKEMFEWIRQRLAE